MFMWRSWTNPLVIQARSWSKQCGGRGKSTGTWMHSPNLGGTWFGCINLMKRYLLNKQLQAAQTGLVHPSLPFFLLFARAFLQFCRKQKNSQTLATKSNYKYIYAQKYVHIFNLTSLFLWLADPEHCFSLKCSEAKFPHFQAALWGQQGQEK